MAVKDQEPTLLTEVKPAADPASRESVDKEDVLEAMAGSRERWAAFAYQRAFEEKPAVF